MEKSDIYKIKHIERYLRGEMDKEELKSFENELEKSENLKNKVEKIKDLPKELYEVEKDRLASQVKDWIKADKLDGQPLVAKPPSKVKYLRVVGIAASIVALLLVTGYWLMPLPNQNVNEIAQNYVAEYHKSPIVLRASTDERWEAAIQSYRDRNFEQMKVQMAPIMTNEDVTTEQQFYFALAHLYSKPAMVDEALFYFDQSKNQDSSMYSEEIAWYQALIYIQQEEFDKARLELIKIENSNQFGTGVKDLLKVLK